MPVTESYARQEVLLPCRLSGVNINYGGDDAATDACRCRRARGAEDDIVAFLLLTKWCEYNTYVIHPILNLSTLAALLCCIFSADNSKNSKKAGQSLKWSCSAMLFHCDINRRRR